MSYVNARNWLSAVSQNMLPTHAPKKLNATPRSKLQQMLRVN
ncbi:hypothetical protein [Mastigocoleus testarum]|nr:hypothetical protein [Mastigocoleus testarum]